MTNKLDGLINSYLDGTSSPGEQQLLDNFADQAQNDLRWNDAQMGNKQAVFNAINRTIRNQTRPATSRFSRRQRIGWSVSVAASLLLLVGIYSWLKMTPPTTQLYSFSTRAQADSLALPDGSVIYLSPETELSYDSRFNSNSRTIELVRGNAFFKVARDPEKPFIISSGAIRTRVLGTSFNIHCGNGSFRITVHTGKVNVSSEAESVDLLPLQEASYSLATKKLNTTRVSPAAISPWYNSNVTLADQSIGTILNLIEQKFNLDSIQVESEKRDTRATVYIARDASLQSVLEQLNYITNLKFETDGKNLSCR